MLYRDIRTCALSLCAAFTLSSCIVPGIQQLADNIGVQEVDQKCNVERPQDLVVYSWDGAYFVEMQLRFESVSTRMFYIWGMFSTSGGFEVGKPTAEDRARNPYRTYLVELSAQNVFKLLQRKVETVPEDKLRMIAAADFDYARAVRCPAKPAKLKFTYDKTATYYPAESYCPRLGYHTTTLHTLARPLAWAAWGVEVPVFVVSNAALYTVYAPYRLICNAIWGSPG